MDNVKFFDKNGVEICEGDVINTTAGKMVIDYFVVNRIKDKKLSAIAQAKDKAISFCCHEVTKHTPKLTKIKRTFEEVCELRDSGAMFRTANADHYKPSIMKTSADIYIIGEKLRNLKFKPTNSDTWQDLEYKEVEE
jgi:hypothetical protein